MLTTASLRLNILPPFPLSCQRNITREFISEQWGKKKKKNVCFLVLKFDFSKTFTRTDPVMITGQPILLKAKVHITERDNVTREIRFQSHLLQTKAFSIGIWRRGGEGIGGKGRIGEGRREEGRGGTGMLLCFLHTPCMLMSSQHSLEYCALIIYCTYSKDLMRKTYESLF